MENPQAQNEPSQSQVSAGDSQVTLPQPDPPASEPPVPTPPPEKSKSKTILLVGVGLLVLALVGIGVYYFVFRETTPTPTPTPGPVATQAPTPTPDTSDWKTYSSDKLGISFKYPSNWFEFINQADKVAFTTTDPNLGGNLKGIWATKHLNSAKLTLKDFWKKQHEGASEDYINELESNYLEETTIDSYQALRENPDSAPEKLEMTRIFIEKSPFIYEIQGITPEGNEQEKTTFNQILSTFEFTEATPSATPTATPTSTPSATTSP